MSFLVTFLQLAHDVAQAERGVALSPQLEVLGLVNVDGGVLDAPKFTGLMHQIATQARDSDAVVITNNVITDPSQAPTTNVSFADLRALVAIPLPHVGIIYLDRPIRLGVIPRETLEKLKAFAESLFADAAHTTLTLDELKARYAAL